MSEWQPIETAPIGATVRLGWWEDRSYYADKQDALLWRTDVGVAAEMRGFIVKWPAFTSDGKKATHWQPLPEPPK